MASRGSVYGFYFHQYYFYFYWVNFSPFCSAPRLQPCSQMNLPFITSPKSSAIQRNPSNLTYCIEMILQQTLLWKVTKHSVGVIWKNKIIHSIIMLIMFIFLVFQILFPLLFNQLLLKSRIKKIYKVFSLCAM